ncbi:MAG: DUF3842 family protein [Treponema sp.]|nr:DUF3842 family protein [Treponema sp.]
MNILVIDGMGGGIGKSIIEHIKGQIAGAEITAAGTNSIATSSMLKAGANYGATGENAIIYNCRKADFIIGAIGIIFANSLHGEISPKMAEAVSSSSAHKILLPIDKCNVSVLGVADKPIQSYMSEIIEKITKNSGS